LLCVRTVLAVFPQLPGFGGNDNGARPLGGPCHDLALGPAFRAHSESTAPSRTPARPNRSWRVDETHVRVAGQWTYLYRAVDSAGDTIDFMLSAKRDLTAAKLFLRLALSGSGGVRPRVVNVDGHPAYGRAIAELKDSRDLSWRCRCRPSPYLNNIIEQDHRFIKKRITVSLGFGSPEGAWRTIEGYEAMHMIRKGQV
jgi:transposase, IS6 family